MPGIELLDPTRNGGRRSIWRTRSATSSSDKTKQFARSSGPTKRTWRGYPRWGGRSETFFSLGLPGPERHALSRRLPRLC